MSVILSDLAHFVVSASPTRSKQTTFEGPNTHWKSVRHRAVSQGHSGGQNYTVVESMFRQSLALWPKSYAAALLREKATTWNTLNSVLPHDSGVCDFV